MVTIAFAGLALGYAVGQLGRHFLLRALEQDAPETYFLELGAPRRSQLASGGALATTGQRALKSRFRSFVWAGEFLWLGAPSVTLWGCVAYAGDLCFAASLCLFVYGTVNDG